MSVKETPSPGLSPAVDWGPVRTLNLSRMLLLICAPLLVLQLLGLVGFSTRPGDSGVLLVSIRAESQADYRSDPFGSMVPGVTGNILYDIILDLPGSGSPADRLAELEADLAATIPAATPQPTSTPASGPPLPIDPVVSLTPQKTETSVIPPTPTSGGMNPTVPVPATPTSPVILPTATPRVPTLPPLLPTNTAAPPVSSSPTPILSLPTLPPILPTLPPLLPTLTSLFP